MKKIECEEQKRPLIFKCSVGGFCGASYRVNINYIEETCTYIKYDSGYSNEVIVTKDFNKEKMNSLFDKLYEIMKTLDRNYNTDEIIMDGTNWVMELITNKERMISEGSNAYPGQWNSICSLISNYIGCFR